MPSIIALLGWFSSVAPPKFGMIGRLGDRLMYRLAYRNFGGHEALVVNHSVAVGGGKGSTVGMRWYELATPNATPTVVQPGTYGLSDGVFRWMASAAMDKVGNQAIG